MIEVRNVSKEFDGKKVLDNISFSMEKGKIYGLIGENGAGKTTLLQMLAGIYKVEEGSILMEGQAIYENSQLKQRLAYVADKNQFFRNYTGLEILDFYQGIYNNFSQDDFEAYNQIFQLDLSKKIKQFSKGMQMRLSLMLNMASNPEVLILDEPSSGLDPMAKKDLLSILIGLVEKKDMLIIISSHHIIELEKICDEVIILSRGRLKYESNIDSIKSRIRKLQVVFDQAVENPDEEIKKLGYVLNVDRIGSIYYIVVDNSSGQVEEDLSKLGASLIESLGMGLEEIFIYENRGNRGDCIE